MAHSRNALAKMTIGSKEYMEQTKKIQQLKGVMDEHLKLQGKIATGWQKVKSNIMQIGAGNLLANTFSNIGSTISTAFSDAFTKIKEFGKGISELRSITGASGEDLEFLKQKAIDLAAVYGISAKEIVNAMKMVGSAKPELLSNVAALSAVTEAVITLSKAASMDLATSTESLTTIMNQFGHGAELANQDINILAAGSKYGAVEVDYLAQSLVKVGTVMKSANLTLEQGVAAMELFGEKGVKAEIAGTGFKSLLIKLQADTKNYTNGIFDLNKAIDNNQSISGDNLELQKKFGAEYFNLAQILFQGKVRFNELSTQVTDTNTAFEQASINMDNLSGDMDKASGAWDRFVLSVDSGDGVISKALRSIVSGFSNLVTIIGDINKGESLQLSVGRIKADIGGQSKKKLDADLAEIKKYEKDKTDFLNNQLKKGIIDKKKYYEEIAKIEGTKDSMINEKIDTYKKVAKELAIKIGVVNKEIEKSLILDPENKKMGMTKFYKEKQAELMLQKEAFDIIVKKLEPYQKQNQVTSSIDNNTIKTTENNSKSKSKAHKAKEEADKEIELLKDFKRNYASMTKQIDDLRKKANYETLTDEEKQVQMIGDKYDEQLSVVQGFIDELNLKSKKKEGLNQDELDLLEKFYNQQIQLVDLKQSELEDKLKEFEAKKTEDREKTTKSLMDGAVNAVGEVAKVPEDKKKKKDGELSDLAKQILVITEYAGLAKDALGSLFEIQSAKQAEELRQFEDSNNKKKASLDTRLKKGLISEDNYNKQVAELDSKLEIKRKQFDIEEAKRNKRMRLFEAVINTAASVARASYSLPLALAVGALGAIQIAAIAAQPIPKAAKGMRVNKPTILQAGEAGREIVLSNSIVDSPQYGAIADDLARVQEGKQPRFIGSPSAPNYKGMSKAIDRTSVQTVQNNTINHINNVDNKSIDSMNEKIELMSKNLKSFTTVVANIKHLKAIISYDTQQEFERDENYRTRYTRL